MLLSKMLSALLFAFGAHALLRNKLIPADTQRELMAAGTGVVDDEPLTPACSMIGCADIQCLPPLKLQRRPGQCCPICWAEDHAVPLDRHSAMGKSPYATSVHAAAPPTCAGAKCFTPLCIAGQMPGYVPGSCCEQCK